MPKKSDKSVRKRSRSPISNSQASSHGHKSKKYAIPAGSSLDANGNLMPPPQQHVRTPSLASMTSVRSNTSSLIVNNPGPNNNSGLNPSSVKPKPIIVEAGLIATNSFLTPLQLTAKPLVKTMGQKRTQILSASAVDKEKIIKKLKEQNFQFYTYSEPSQKPTIYVLKKYFAAETEDLLKTLQDQEVSAEKVTVLCPNPDFPSFLVHFKSQTVNLTSLQRNVKAVNCVIVKWERFDRSRKRLTQCHNCQSFGHASSNCGMKRRCIKCLEDHLPGDCSRKNKDEEGTPKCVNCQGDHAANSSICPSYISYSGMVQRQRTNRQAAATVVSNQHRRSAHQASPVAAAPIFDRSNFPNLSPHSLPLTQNVSNNLNGTALGASNFAKISSLQARLAAVSDMSEVIEKFEALVVSLESAQSVEQKIFILVQMAGIQNGN